MKNQRNTQVALAALVLAALACNAPAASSTESAFTATPTATATETPTPEQACLPNLVTNSDANVRKGPSQEYEILGIIPQGGSATVDGKNADASWWYIQFAAGENGHGWIAASITTATCIPETLAIINPPPPPVVIQPSNTPAPVVDNPPSATPTKKFQIDLPLIPIFTFTPTPKPIIIPPIIIKP